MTIKSATPSGSQRERVLVDLDTLRAYINRQPLPLDPALCALALDLELKSCGYDGSKMPGRHFLAKAWGIGERQARTIIDAWWAGRGAE